MGTVVNTHHGDHGPAAHEPGPGRPLYWHTGPEVAERIVKESGLQPE
jgi:hypothetical protein